MKDIDLQAERAAFEAWFEPYWNGPQSDLAAWSGWKARAAVEADRAQRVPDGYDQGSAECMAAVQEILDGKDRGEGVANEPWESTRRRLIALVAPAPAQQDIPLEFQKVLSDNLWDLYADGAAPHQEPLQQERKPMTHVPCRTCEGAGGFEVSASSTSYFWRQCPDCAERHHGIKE